MGNGEESTSIIKVEERNPDDAIEKARVKGDYIPEAGDRVIRCVEIDRKWKNA